MIEIKEKQIIIDGKPQIIMCGEIHYYRLKRSEWQDRIDKLKLAGCNAVASYVPWLIHEPVEGQIDLSGKTRPELDLAAYIDLCTENGLYFFVRPGPFVMAEMKNEGLPYWIYEKYPEIIPVCWNGQQATTKTVDYMHPGFLQECKRWYKSVMEVVSPRLQTNGGSIIGLQLDNEIGMLSWASNCPDLTDFVLDDFFVWLDERYGRDEVAARYPINLKEIEKRNESVRSPKEEFAPALMKDLGYYMRHRFAKYVAELRGYAEEYGVKDIPFVVNIHGTSNLRGLTFPIGISQLYESYTQGPGYLSGSDIYFGDLTMGTFQDLYIINAMMDAVHTPDQPLTSVEFNCGDGNFGDNYGGRYDPSAADLKTRMSIAQGNRLLNYYLFAGGTNYRMEEKRGDGNDRIAFTGERHGFAAPVSPEGKLNYTFPRMARAIKTIMAVEEKAAVMNEERDPVSFAFIPDYFMTEYQYPESEQMKEIASNLEGNRAGSAWENVGRAMLLGGYRFGSTDIQNNPLSVETTPVLVLPSARYMSSEIQEKLTLYLEDGGGLLLYGEIPQYDMEGNDCTILADALGVRVTGVHRDFDHNYLSLYAENWAAPRPEVRTYFAQVFTAGEKAAPLLKVYKTDEICAADIPVGKGRAVIMATSYSCDISFIKEIIERLGASARYSHDCEEHGVFLTTTANEEGERFIHLLNLDGFDKTFRIFENGQPLFDGEPIMLQSRDGVMLPINLALKAGKVIASTAEITKNDEDLIEFRLTQPVDRILIESDRTVKAGADYTVNNSGNQFTIKSKKHAKIDDKLVIEFK
ncbi:beta-galactosidase [Falsibacillus albus]|uniref:Glycosyl hydrolase n=1 Tax=Falsibacillus albus TaxID=2478915 RepID=A0A3L7K0P1_9BACI|nr:beta-galactosidase [Falsibacillus albus]RLQ96616.1 glycosyl hydrolase [Falsibacillus albus]